MLGKRTTMTRLTVNIDNQNLEKKVKDFLDDLGLDYQSESSAWWEDDGLLKELDQRSDNLKLGKDAGFSFNELKEKIK